MSLTRGLPRHFSGTDRSFPSPSNPRSREHSITWENSINHTVVEDNGRKKYWNNWESSIYLSSDTFKIIHMVECWVRLKSPPASAWCQCVWMPIIFFDVAGHHGIPLKKFFVLTSSRKLRHLIHAITHLFSFSRNYVRFVHARYHANKHFTQSRTHFSIFTKTRNLFFIFTHCSTSI